MRLIMALAAAALISGAPVRALDEVCAPGQGDPASPHVPDTLVTELIGWIALHTMYDLRGLAASPPEIRFCAVGTDIEYEGQTLRVEPELRAAYDLPKRVVHLVLPWSADNPYDRSVLLHELIHDVQLSNRDWACTGEPEWEAYTLQAIYLEEYGIIAPFDWSGILRLSRCPDAEAVDDQP
ncbi:DUF6647 family protein [Palleronia sp. KMU-117]|uniref:DUF6647 family protein n=1 Tax=Palleronia sp. KMU-117 TaxID=3434108 RepID=UPI003D7352FC